eukprot:TRINITY_DN18038_c0_g1_i2.p1 TRINITY_DN18038_c0_g1~~TRINITY_DN18038_c0_g1_i2.p1  ORF type:complete len:1063 (+),score=240.03 TRINITY_DN18038_c0_g1_i2:38-3190(+)
MAGYPGGLYTRPEDAGSDVDVVDVLLEDITYPESLWLKGEGEEDVYLDRLYHKDAMLPEGFEEEMQTIKIDDADVQMLARRASIRLPNGKWKKIKSTVTGYGAAVSMWRGDTRLKVYDEEWIQEESAASTIQRMFRMHNAKVQKEDDTMWEAFKMIDEAQEWHTVTRMERMRKLQNALCNIAGESVSIDHSPKRRPGALPCPTTQSIKDMMRGFKEGKHIPMTDAISIVEAALLLFSAEPTVNHIKSEGGNTVVIGDIHGSLYDILHILEEYGLPGAGLKYVVNGDIVDRGENSVECLLLILSLKLSTPEAVYINRGNHEDKEVNVFYGFIEECKEKYDLRFYELCSQLFDWLPLATCLNNEVCILHGGLTSEPNLTLDELAAFSRGPDYLIPRSDRQEKIMSDIKWSDPHKSERYTGTGSNQRGKGIVFGADVTELFLKENGLKMLVRSHEEQKTGYKLHHNGKLITIFSASNYGGHGNGGACLLFEPDQAKPVVHKWRPKPVEKRKKGKREADNLALMLRYMEETIVENEDTLLAYWSAVDKKKTGLVTPAEWAQGMRAELRLDQIPLSLKRLLLGGGSCAGDKINYKRFLSYQNNKYTKRLSAYGKVLQWHNDAVGELAGYLKKSAIDFEKAFDLFDDDKSGKLCFKEFKAAIRKVVSLDVLSNKQIEGLARAFDVSGDGEISKTEFINKLNEVGPDTALHVEWSKDRREEGLKQLKGKVAPMGKDHVLEVLQAYDVNGDGRLSNEELRDAVTKGLKVPYYNQVFSDLTAAIGDDDDEETFTLQAVARAFPINSVDIKSHSVNRPQCTFPGLNSFIEYGVTVTPDKGKPWMVNHRYSNFVSLKKQLKGSDIPNLPSKLPVLSEKGIRTRMTALDAWLKCVAQKALKTSAIRRPLKVFLRVPSGATREPDAKTLSIERIAEELCQVVVMKADSKVLTPALGAALLKLLYRYRTELKHVFYSRDGVSSGVIPVSDFRATLVSLNELEGYPLTRAQVDLLVRKMDINRDGFIDYTEFEQAVTAEASRTASPPPMGSPRPISPPPVRSPRE